MRTPWCSSYFSFRPRRIEIVSSTVGSATNTGWKRRASAASFSMCLRYSSSVVAPTQCSSPRASAGFSMLEASIAPSALPAPTRVCSSSMKRMMSPSAGGISGSTAFSRSSNSPRYLAPATMAPRSSAISFLSLQRLRHVAVDDAQRQALGDGGLADAGLADQHRVVLGAPAQHLDGAADLLVAADHRVELALARRLGEVAGVFLQRVVAAPRPPRSRRCGPCAARAMAFSSACGLTLPLASASAASVPLASASASSMRSTVTKESPAFSAICFGLVEDARRLRRHVDLARALAFDLGLLGEVGFDRAMDGAGIAACGRDQVGGEALRVVEQDLQQVVGNEPLVAFAQSQHLGALQEAAHALGVLLLVHFSTLSFAPPSSAGERADPLQRHPDADMGRVSDLARPDRPCGFSRPTMPGYHVRQHGHRSRKRGEFHVWWSWPCRHVEQENRPSGGHPGRPAGDLRNGRQELADQRAVEPHRCLQPVDFLPGQDDPADDHAHGGRGGRGDLQGYPAGACRRR